MKRSSPLATRQPPRRGKPLERTKALRRATIVRATTLARKAPARKRKTTVGEFPPKTRRLLYERFAHRCAWCGDPLRPGNRTCQHRVARGMGGSRKAVTSSPAAGVGVHQIPCHEHIEAHPTEALQAGYRVPQGTDPRAVSLLTWTGQRVFLTDDGGVSATPPEERA